MSGGLSLYLSYRKPQPPWSWFAIPGALQLMPLRTSEGHRHAGITTKDKLKKKKRRLLGGLSHRELEPRRPQRPSFTQEPAGNEPTDVSDASQELPDDILRKVCAHASQSAVCKVDASGGGPCPSTLWQPTAPSSLIQSFFDVCSSSKSVSGSKWLPRDQCRMDGFCISHPCSTFDHCFD